DNGLAFEGGEPHLVALQVGGSEIGSDSALFRPFGQRRQRRSRISVWFGVVLALIAGRGGWLSCILRAPAPGKQQSGEHEQNGRRQREPSVHSQFLILLQSSIIGPRPGLPGSLSQFPLRSRVQQSHARPCRSGRQSR